MRGKSLVSKYLILSIIILAVGIPTAYAITITLGGDPVIINGILDLMGNRITNVGTPTTSTDAATKAYVDSASGTDTLALLGCTNNQVAQFVGSVWVCVDKVSDADALDGIDSTGFSQGAHTIDTDTVPWNSRVPQSTILTTVDSTGDVGKFTSITIGTDGLPVISYYDVANTNLKVVHCTNASCSTSDTPTTVDSSANVGETTSITIGTDGFPIISYLDSTNGDLKVVHCLNVSCSGIEGVGFETPTTVDNTNVGEESSITIGIDGLPVISYYDLANTALKVAHCSNASCSSGSPVVIIVDNAADVGLDTSITIGINGFPIISYRDNTGTGLKVAHCGNASCSSGNTITPIASNIRHTSITIKPDGLPMISFYDVTNTGLNFVRCGNAFCSSGNQFGLVDSGGDVGQHTSITIGADAFPVISYYDVTNTGLKIIHCGSITCSTGNVITTVDSADLVGEYTSIAIGTDGLPVISYYDLTNGALKVAKCTNPLCLNNWTRR